MVQIARVGTAESRQDHFGKARAGLLYRQFHRAQRRIGECGRRQVVVTDDGKISRNRETDLARGAHRANRHAIGGAQQRRRPRRRRERGPGRAITALFRREILDHEQLQSRRCHGARVAAAAQSREGEGGRRGKVRDAAAAERLQPLGGAAKAALTVAVDMGVRQCAFGAAERDKREALGG